jgi:hypothetical protein
MGTPSNINTPFDWNLYTQQIEINDLNKLSKGTLKNLEQNAHKSDADWRFTAVRIFIKQQQKIATPTLGSGIKAGQTLAQFNDRVILFYGPMTRYISEIDTSLRPRHHYYHAGKSPASMNAWCMEFLDPSSTLVRTTSDFTAFDQSQTEEALAFEILRMNQRSIPHEIVTQYIGDKTSLTCQLGPLQTMRHTGEGPTWKFNTDFSYALCGLMYSFPSGTPIMVSGDDTEIDFDCEINPVWPKICRHFTIVAKMEKTTQALFCSYIVSGDGIIKDPLPLAHKIHINLDHGTPDQLYSLYSEHGPTYQKADILYKHLTSEQLEAVAYINRIGVKVLGSQFLPRMAVSTHNPLDFANAMEQVYSSLADPTLKKRPILAHLRAIYHLLPRSLQVKQIRLFRSLHPSENFY